MFTNARNCQKGVIDASKVAQNKGLGDAKRRVVRNCKSAGMDLSILYGGVFHLADRDLIGLPKFLSRRKLYLRKYPRLIQDRINFILWGKLSSP
jgi:hypothetical protein